VSVVCVSVGGGAVSLAVATPQFIIHSSLGQADLALTVYLTIAALAAFLWLVDGGDRYAALAGLMAGAASWTKLEGAFTAVVILLAVVVVRRSVRTPCCRASRGSPHSLSLGRYSSGFTTSPPATDISRGAQLDLADLARMVEPETGCCGATCDARFLGL